MPDAVVIGSGPNGLVAANLLADRGWSVEVLEAQPEPGGAVKSGELIEPGFTNDLFSAFYPLASASKVIRDLHLEEHGLRWRRSPLVLANPTPDGRAAILSIDLDETVAALEKFAPGDGDAWRDLYEKWERLEDGLLGALLTPFPPVRALLKILARLRPSEILPLARFGTLPVRRLGEEAFAGDAGRLLLAGNALHADFAPESAISGFFGWLLTCVGQSMGYPVPEGGAGSLTRALVARLESKGGTVTCGRAATGIVVRGGRAVAVQTDAGDIDAGRAVLADVAAPLLYGHLVAPEHLPQRVLDGIRRFQWDTSTIKVDWNLDGPIPWTAEEARRAGTVHVVDSVDHLSEVAMQLATKQIPARPFLLFGQYSMTDPTRHPEGKETAWAYTHVPQEPRGDAAGVIDAPWSQGALDAFVERMEQRVEDAAPGFRSLIRGRHVFSPTGLEDANANLVGGAINGGTAQLHQQLVFRPVPGMARAETPIKGLFLASSSAHPGGGVHGACGSNAARAALLAERIGRSLPG